jgi:hypothetical protein
MNIYQRIILILGAIALVVAILTTPQVFYTSDHAYMVFLNIAVGRSIGVIGATVLIFFALKGINNKEKQKRR